jgi:hypothetical protein
MVFRQRGGASTRGDAKDFDVEVTPDRIRSSPSSSDSPHHGAEFKSLARFRSVDGNARHAMRGTSMRGRASTAMLRSRIFVDVANVSAVRGCGVLGEGIAGDGLRNRWGALVA